jgi:hypothetical protein
VNTITQSLGFLLNGHPIIAFEQSDDVALFDLTTGWGSGYLANWAICNGNSYLNPVTNKRIITPNLIDRCLVQSTGTYNVDDTAGSQNINLTIPQLPVHTHGLTDTGHVHHLTDPGHNHGIDEHGGHTHATTPGTVAGATGSTTSNSGHSHNTINQAFVKRFDGLDPVGYIAPIQDSGHSALGSSTYLQSENSHTHNVAINSFNVDVTISDAATGLSIVSDTIGITDTDSATTGIAIANTGSGANVDVRQPSYAVLYAMKIY